MPVSSCSRKPDALYAMLEAYCPYCPGSRLEMFSRTAARRLGRVGRRDQKVRLIMRMGKRRAQQIARTALDKLRAGGADLRLLLVA